ETLLPREEDEEEIAPMDNINMDVEVVKDDKRPAADVSSPTPVLNDAGSSKENAAGTATALVHPGEADRELLLKLLQVHEARADGFEQSLGEILKTLQELKVVKNAVISTVGVGEVSDASTRAIKCGGVEPRQS
ncbi:unnamed protein product, partial [Amoebophrya sp. A120]